ncbi:MAG: hypothetical protein K6D38_03270 [Pseudobutyrivibrio sp.]|nr:hypothetical protein [Pseudobutyrivibrio sp.]
MKNSVIQKLFASSLIIILVLIVVACGNSSNDKQDDYEDDVDVTFGDIEFPENDEGTIIADALEEEDSEAAIINYAKENAPAIDIEGCDTFTQIVDEKLTAGMGYANINIEGVDALIVCSSTYDNLDGNMAAIDGTIFIYKDGVPLEAGKVCSGGTAYPLAIKDGKLMSASNHWIAKYMIVDDRVLMIEHGAVEYDSAGNSSYNYDRIDNYSDGSEIGEPEDMVNKMFDDMGEGEVIGFDVIK